MKRPSTIRFRNSSKQQGFAYLTVIFLGALLTIAAAAASLNVLTNGKREKVKEMIWRGNQYVRAIRLYYMKNRRFPGQLEDLYKPQTGSIRFLRQPYKDPMNKEDGSWRLIYVGPSGQLVGSLKPRTGFQLPVPGGPGAGSAPGAPGMTQASNPPGTAGAGAAVPGAPSAQPGAPGAAGTGSSTPGQPGDAASGGTTDLPPGNVDTPSVFGGSVIGIGSKIDASSVVVCDKGKNYRLFEFIWDPGKNVGGCGQSISAGGPVLPVAPGVNPGQQPGQPGQQPGQPSQPGQGGLNPPGMPPTSAPPPPQN